MFYKLYCQYKTERLLTQTTNEMSIANYRTIHALVTSYRKLYSQSTFDWRKAISTSCAVTSTGVDLLYNINLIRHSFEAKQTFTSHLLKHTELTINVDQFFYDPEKSETLYPDLFIDRLLKDLNVIIDGMSQPTITHEHFYTRMLYSSMMDLRCIITKAMAIMY